MGLSVYHHASFWRNGETASLLVEFASIFPVVMLLVLGLIDLSRYSMTKSILSEASRRSAMRAVTHPHLELDSHEGVTPGIQEQYSAALEELRTVAKGVLFVGDYVQENPSGLSPYLLGEVEIDIPDSSPSLPRRESLASEPITITVSIGFPLIILAGNSLTLTSQTSAYRDDRTLMMPLARDHNNNVISTPTSELSDWTPVLPVNE